MWTSSCVLLLALVAACEGAKVLGLFTVPGTSHMSVNAALVKELARRGHEVTVYSSLPEDKVIPNYTLHYVNVKLRDLIGGLEFELMPVQKANPILMVVNLWVMGQVMCKLSMEDIAIQKLLHSNEHYDVVIMETFFTECLMPFAHKFNAPLIQICAFGGAHWMGDWFGNPNPYSYVPDAFLSFTDSMTFWERFQNTLAGFASRAGRYFYYLPKLDALMKKYYNQTKDLPSAYDLETSTDLLLLNSHFSISYPKPLMPNMIQVGGMHIKPPQKLPEDIQEFLDSAKDGVVYFSMGSNLKSVHFPEEYKKAFLEAFSKLKQKVLWKFEGFLMEQPSNLKVAPWMPQSDILAHPNVRAFITHGGLLGSQEAIAGGVPVIGIPLYGDQMLNVQRAIKGGYGVLLDLYNISTPSVTWALEEVLSNPKYTENAKRLSKIYLDQPMSPLDTAVYWTEYVIRHNGTSHMRSAALDLYSFQYFLLDVIVFLVFVVVGLLWSSFVILRTVVRMCKTKKVAVSQKNKVKKN